MLRLLRRRSLQPPLRPRVTRRFLRRRSPASVQTCRATRDRRPRRRPPGGGLKAPSRPRVPTTWCPVTPASGTSTTSTSSSPLCQVGRTLVCLRWLHQLYHHPAGFLLLLPSTLYFFPLSPPTLILLALPLIHLSSCFSCSSSSSSFLLFLLHILPPSSFLSPCLSSHFCLPPFSPSFLHLLPPSFSSLFFLLPLPYPSSSLSSSSSFFTPLLLPSRSSFFLSPWPLLSPSSSIPSFSSPLLSAPLHPPSSFTSLILIPSLLLLLSSILHLHQVTDFVFLRCFHVGFCCD